MKFLKLIYSLPVLPILLMLVWKEYNSPWYSEGKISNELKSYAEKYKWHMRILAFVGWLFIIKMIT